MRHEPFISYTALSEFYREFCIPFYVSLQTVFGLKCTQSLKVRLGASDCVWNTAVHLGGVCVRK